MLSFLPSPSYIFYLPIREEQISLLNLPSYHFFVPFLHSWCSKLPPHIIPLLSKELHFAFLSEKVGGGWAMAPLRMALPRPFVKDIHTGYRILVDSSLLAKECSPSFGIHSFWWEIHSDVSCCCPLCHMSFFLWLLSRVSLFFFFFVFSFQVMLWCVWAWFFKNLLCLVCWEQRGKKM